MEKTKSLDSSQKLDDAQKEAVAEVRKVAEAKLAELEIMFKRKMSQLSLAGGNPSCVEEARKEYLQERSEVEDLAEYKVLKIKGVG